MGNCYLIYNLQQAKEKSNLYKDLLNKFNGNVTKADIIYKNLITKDIDSNDSLYNWLIKNDYKVDATVEPTIEQYENWINYLTKYNRENLVFKTNNYTSTAEEFIELSEALYYHINQTLLKKNLTFNDVLYSNINIVNIINNSFERLLDDLYESLDKETDDDNIERLNLIIENIEDLDKRNLLFDNFNNYFKRNFRLSINKYDSFNEDLDSETILDESIQFKNEIKTKDTAFNKSPLDFDTKDNAPQTIKLLISSLIYDDKISNLGLPKLVPYQQVFNLLTKELAQLPGDINIMLTKLNELSEKHSYLKPLIKTLNFGKENYVLPSNKNQAIREMQLRTQFVNHFDKTKYEYSIQVYDGETVKVFNPTTDKTENIIFEKWRSNFELLKTLNPTLYSEEGYNKFKKLKSIESILKYLGIESVNYKIFDREDIEAIVNYGFNSYEDFLNIYNRRSDVSGVIQRLQNLAYNESLLTDDVIELTHFNLEGKQQYDISLNSFLSIMIKDFNYYAGNEEKLKELYPRLFDNPRIKNSLWASWIVNNLSNEELDTIFIGVTEGIKNNDSGITVSFDTAQDRDLIMTKLNAFFQRGHYSILRTADRKVENYIRFSHIKSIDDAPVQNRANLKELLKGYLIDEVNLLKSYKYNKPGVSNSTREDLFDTRIFSLSNGTSIYDKISLEKLYELDESDIKLNPIVNEFMDEFINDYTKSERNYIEQWVNEEEINKLHDTTDSINKFIWNSLVGNIEFTKVFLGDVKLFKNEDDLVKRLSMLNSTKESTRTDDEMNNFISSLTNKFEEKYGYTDGREPNSSIKTVTVNDVTSSISEYSEDEFNLIKEELGEIGLYNEINEPDGFAIISFDEARIMFNRYSLWNIKLESLYDKIADGYNPNGKNTYNITKDEYGLLLPNKSQYTGVLENELYHIIAGRKFSFIIAAPGVFRKGSTLEKMSSELYKTGTGMIFYTSAAKMAYNLDENGTVASIYDKDGNYVFNLDENSTYDILDYKFMGNQLKINHKEKINK